MYSVFISHAWDYNDDYYRLEDMLDDAEDFEWRNYSVPEHDAIDSTNEEELVDALRNQIRPTNIVLITSGMYVPYRKWIQKEIDIALEMNKPIIGIVPRGHQNVPREVQDVADEIVGWSTSSIVEAIERLSI